MYRRYTADMLRSNLHEIFVKFAAVLVHLFGSQVTGRLGPMSDVDLAVLWDDKEQQPMMKSLALQEAVRTKLQDEKFEIGPLNEQPLSFCYNVIKDGVCIFGKESDRVRYETYILNEYLDFLYLAEEYNKAFTKAVCEEKRIDK
ncbi:MAG: nucleotidyltransferase domain-containing protein [Candidatus Omnitrophota bacterium]